MKIFWELRGFFLRNWPPYLAAVVMLTLVALLLMLPPHLIGEFVDRIAQQTLDADYLMMTVGELLGLAVLIYIFRVLWRIFLFGASHKLAAETRQDLYRHWTTMSPQYFRKHTTGDLMAHATNDVEALQMTAGEGILATFDGLLTGVIVLAVMMITLSWDLTLVALLPWPIMAIFMYQFGRSLHTGFSDAQASFGALTELSQESISGIRTIKAYGQEDAMARQFANAAETATQAYMKVAATDAKYEPTIVLTIGASFLSAVTYGGWLIHQQTLTLGQLTSFTMYLGYLIWPMFAFGWMLNIAERGSAAYDRIKRLLAEAPQIPDTGELTSLPDTSLQVAIDEFQYPDQEPVAGDAEQSALSVQAALREIQFHLAAGKTLGITGPTGSGKTTLIKLILRQYALPSGSVAWGGESVERYQQAAFRAHVAYVPQEPFLFSTTVEENLSLGRPEASREEIEKAAGLAALHEDIELFQNGYDTVVGERGVTLSGGQKQRLALARALLIEAPVLILDDALSAVDTGTENRILQHLKGARRDTTTIIVSHRLSALRHADKILVLDQGQIREQGNHSELVAQAGWYSQIYELQQIEQDLDRVQPQDQVVKQE
ncbi:ABC-type multidrug transport system, ATPase and permease components [Hahella chejuensis KCTC 2396]|uniref:Multidrug resistance-like ATP-binding protein MdlA n=1 Tax=Hahella chejuensis (strain KCTC 2396) TaxID=349521 RepID=Q2SKE8_HAHCH|nr:ABC transporter transmembrane domain-containing protein [Hahella chejuensis]ABC28876.1 ABC-type multidrug transport system, ATPase and permease components [Hahella chejuensis KCTC 2396]